MKSIAQPRPDHRYGQLKQGLVLGGVLVATGFGLAFLTIDTPFVSRLVPLGMAGTSHGTTAMLVWSLTIVAVVALLVSVAKRLVTAITPGRSRPARGSLVMPASRDLPTDAEIVTGVVPRDGRPIPELAVGTFGVALVHALGGLDRIRLVDGAWEARTRHGWQPTDDPLERLARDADRLRRRLTAGDLDFVVRVHAALVTSNTSIPRSPACAVITAGQIPAWLEALPRQRSISTGRCQSLLARVREAVADEGQRGSW
jgi:hypothetical protein